MAVKTTQYHVKNMLIPVGQYDVRLLKMSSVWLHIAISETFSITQVKMTMHNRATKKKKLAILLQAQI